MRVLYLPRGHGLGDKHSTSMVPKMAFRHMLEADPELFVLWLVAKGTDQATMEQYRAEMPDPERLQFLETDARPLGRMMQYFLSQSLWDQLTQTKAVTPYDVVLNQFFGATTHIATLLWNRYEVSRYNVDVPIVNWHLFTLTRSQLEAMPQDFAGEPDLATESLSAFYGRNVWESDYLYREHLKTLREWALPSVIRKVEDRSEVVNNGVNHAMIAEVREKRARRMEAGDGPTLFYGGRLAAVKNIQTTLPMIEKAAVAAGADLLVSSQTTMGDKQARWAEETLSVGRLETGVHKTQYLALMGEGDVFACHSQAESYGTGWLEMLAAGMLGVFDDRPWVRSLLPDWYPFVTSSKTQQLEMLVALAKDWPDGPLWTRYVPMVQEWLAEDHDEKRGALRLLEIVHEEKRLAMARQEHLGRSTYGQLAVEGAKLAFEEHGAPVPAEAVWMKMREVSESDRPWGTRGDIVSQSFLRRCLETAGWRDVCRGMEPEFAPPEGEA